MSLRNRTEFKKLLEQRKAELDRKGVTVPESVRKSPIVRAIVDAAVKDAEDERDSVLSSIDKMLDEKYDGKIEDFIKERPDGLLALEITQLNRLADKINKQTKDTYRAILEGWPVATSTNTRKARKELKAQYNALAQRALSTADSLADTQLALEDFALRKTMEGNVDANQAQLIATIESASQLCMEIMGEMGNVGISIMKAAREIGKGKPFFLGLKADQNLVPTVAIKSAIDFFHSHNRVMQSVGALPNQQRILVSKTPTGGVGTFLKMAATLASLEGGDRMIPALQKQISMAETSGASWKRVQSEAMDVPFNPDTHKQDFYGNIVPLSPDELKTKELGLKTAREKGAMGEVQANPAMNCGCGQNPCITYGKSNPDPLDDLYV